MAQKLISWYAYFYSGFVAIIAPRLFSLLCGGFSDFPRIGSPLLLQYLITLYTIDILRCKKKYTFTILDSMATNCKIQYDNRIQFNVNPHKIIFLFFSIFFATHIKGICIIYLAIFPISVQHISSLFNTLLDLNSDQKDS